MSDAYARFGLGHDATPADFFDAFTAGGTRMYPPNPNYWRSVVALCRFSGGKFTHMELHPLDLGFGRPRPQRGRPLLAQEPLASEVISHLTELSQPFGTKICREGDNWVIRP